MYLSKLILVLPAKLSFMEELKIVISYQKKTIIFPIRWSEQTGKTVCTQSMAGMERIDRGISSLLRLLESKPRTGLSGNFR